MSPYKVETPVDDIVKTLVAVKLSIHRWTGSSLSKSLAREIAESKKVHRDSVGTTVYYLPEELRHEIGKAASALRTLWNSRTLPWKDDGLRVCTADGYMALMEGVSECKSKFMQVVEDHIIGRYDEWVTEARIALGDLYDPSLIPTQEQLRERFGVDFHSEPIVAACDVRIAGMSEAATDMVKRSYEAQIKHGVKSALVSIEEQLREIVQDYSDRLRKDPKRIKIGGLQKTVARVCDGLRSVNITNDKDLDDLLVKMEKNLTTYTTTAIRTSPRKHEHMRELVKEVSDELDSIFG